MNCLLIFSLIVVIFAILYNQFFVEDLDELTNDEEYESEPDFILKCRLTANTEYPAIISKIKENDRKLYKCARSVTTLDEFKQEIIATAHNFTNFPPIIYEKYCPKYERISECTSIFLSNGICYSSDELRIMSDGMTSIKYLLKYFCDNQYQIIGKKHFFFGVWFNLICNIVCYVFFFRIYGETL